MKMKKIPHSSLKVLLVALMAVYPHLGGTGRVDAASAAGGTGGIFAKTGPISGEVLDSSGKPAPGIKLKVMDAKGKEVASATTDAQGKFNLKGLNPGEYHLVIGDNLELSLTMGNSAKQSNFRIILPEEIQRPGAGLIGGAGEEGTNWTHLALAGLVLLIAVPSGFAIAGAIDNDDDGHD